MLSKVLCSDSSSFSLNNDLFSTSNPAHSFALRVSVYFCMLTLSVSHPVIPVSMTVSIWKLRFSVSKSFTYSSVLNQQIRSLHVQSPLGLCLTFYALFHISANFSRYLQGWLSISCHFFILGHAPICKAQICSALEYCGQESWSFVYFSLSRDSTQDHPEGQWFLTSSLESPTCRRVITSLSLFYLYYLNFCFSYLDSSIPMVFTFACLSCFQISSHPYHIFPQRYCTSSFLLSLFPELRICGALSLYLFFHPFTVSLWKQRHQSGSYMNVTQFPFAIFH